MDKNTRMTLEMLADGKCPFPYANFNQTEAEDILNYIVDLENRINEANDLCRRSLETFQKMFGS